MFISLYIFYLTWCQIWR